MSLEHPPGGSWVASDRPVPRLIVRPLREFLDTEVAGGVVLLAAALVALVWANSPWSGAYDALWHTEVGLRLGRWALAADLRHWVNDGLMTIFFFVVGLEIKRELVEGQLADPRRAALPVVAALGGMILPALLYATLNAGGEGSSGWGIVMATDIAFALGVLTLMGTRVPSELKVFLLMLAIADDIGAILVIALFYSGGIQLTPLAVALLGVAAVLGLRALHVWWMPAYVVVGVVVWLAIWGSGVHATIAGVAMGLLTPAHAVDPKAMKALGLAIGQIEEGPSPEDVRMAQQQSTASLSVAEWLAHLLHPWTSFAIVPLFALANAGISLGGESVRAAIGSPVTRGVVLGLVVGKVVGVTGFAWLAERVGVATLPVGVRWLQLAGVSAVAGIGFTVSIFIASLAFQREVLVEEAKVGVLASSLIATALGAGILRVAVAVPRGRSPSP